MLDPSRRRRRVLPPGWAPPMPFPVAVAYWERGRGPDLLWVTPSLVDGQGRVIQYVAAGPAGRPASEGLVASVDMRMMPAGSKVKVVTDLDRQGSKVYGVPYHTAN